MFLKLKSDVKIEDRRGHISGVVDGLRALLASGVQATLDPRRGDCYDLEDGARAYYIYVSPVTGGVVLLAAWPKEANAASLVPLPAFGEPLLSSLALV